MILLLSRNIYTILVTIMRCDKVGEENTGLVVTRSVKIAEIAPPNSEVGLRPIYDAYFGDILRDEKRLPWCDPSWLLHV